MEENNYGDGDDWSTCANKTGTDIAVKKSSTMNLPKLEPRCLHYLQANLFATILEETIKQMRILDECNNELRIIKTMSDMQPLLRKKFGVAERERSDVLEDIDPKKLACSEYKLHKLAADRQMCNKVITNTFLGLALHNCYAPLADVNVAINNLELYRINLEEKEAKNKMQRRDLARQLRQQRNHFKSVTYDTDVIIDTLRKKVEDAALMSEIRSRYVENWQNARTEQHQQTIMQKEAAPSDSIDFYSQRSDHERRVHTEVELLTNIIINETLATVEQWMNKYDTDMEAVDLKIQIKKNDYQNILDKRKHLEKTLAEHDEMIKSWLKFKEDRERARQHYMKMYNAAIVVQAWWRGLLVRQQLGPFKPKRKPPAAKGKTKK